MSKHFRKHFTNCDQTTALANLAKRGYLNISEDITRQGRYADDFPAQDAKGRHLVATRSPMTSRSGPTFPIYADLPGSVA